MLASGDTRRHGERLQPKARRALVALGREGVGGRLLTQCTPSSSGLGDPRRGCVRRACCTAGAEDEDSVPRITRAHPNAEHCSRPGARQGCGYALRSAALGVAPRTTREGMRDEMHDRNRAVGEWAGAPAVVSCERRFRWTSRLAGTS